MKNQILKSMHHKHSILPKSWNTGPIQDIPLMPNHGRQILCVDIQGDIAVTGSADHGLRMYNMNTGKQMRQLYTKAYGHKEWVTSVAFCPNGRILSASMDNYLCHWEAKLISRKDKTKNYLYSASVSKVMVDENNIAISSSYDHSLLIWNLSTQTCQAGLFDAHHDAVLQFDWNNSLVLSGDRKGGVVLWDINKAKSISQSKTHKNQVSKVKLFSDGVDNHLYMSVGAFDGILSLSDMRNCKPIFKKQIHKQSINFVGVTESGILITASGDKSIKLFDVKGGFKMIGALQSTDSVFCGKIIQDMLIVGSGDGNILVYNLVSQQCCFGFGADQAGPIHCLQVSDNYRKQFIQTRKRYLLINSLISLVAGGQSGTGLLMKF